MFINRDMTNTSWYIHTMEYWVAVKKKKGLLRYLHTNIIPWSDVCDTLLNG